MDVYMDVIDTTEQEREALLRDIRYRASRGHAITLRDLDYLSQYDRECYHKTYNQLGLDGADTLKRTPKAEEGLQPSPRIQHVPNPLQATIDELITSIRAGEREIDVNLIDGVSTQQVMELVQEPAPQEREEDQKYQYFSAYEQQSLLNTRA